MSEGEGLVETELGLLQDVLQYELACAERYRRFVSLVMVSEVDDEKKAPGKDITEKVRNSDMMAMGDSSVIILMSETDKNSAESAIERFNGPDKESSDYCYSLVTYPYDNGAAETLMELAEKRLQMAHSEGPGAIVSVG